MGDGSLNKGLLVVLSGPSGVGKGSVCNQLLKFYEGLVYSTSITTREPREGEVEGREYFFTGRERFEQMIEKGDFLEWASVYGNYYGTPWGNVEKNISKGKNVILELDIQGALEVQRRFPEGVYIFLLPPSFSELKKRILNRGTESEKDLSKRLKAAKEEVFVARKYEYLIVNEEINSSAKKVYSIIEAEGCRFERYGEKLIEEVMKK